MKPTEAIDFLNKAVRNAKLVYNDHVVLERCADVLRKEVIINNNDMEYNTDEVTEDVTEKRDIEPISLPDRVTSIDEKVNEVNEKPKVVKKRRGRPRKNK